MDRIGLGSIREWVALYRQQFKTTFATMLQYRASLFIWSISAVLEPVVYLIVWSTVSRGHGGSVGSYTPGGFAAYYIAFMLVNQVTYTWIMYEYEYRVRQGYLSFALLKPVHPIHSDIADNLSSKLITLPILILVAVGLGLIFHPTADFKLWAALAFIPALGAGFPGQFSDRMDAGPGGLLDHPRQRHQPVVLRPGAVPLRADRSNFALPGLAPDHRGGAAVQVYGRLPGGVGPGTPDASSSGGGIGCPGGVGAHQPGAGPPGLAVGGAGVFGGGHMNTLRLLYTYFRVNVLSETAYRVNFFIQLFQSLLELGTSLAGLAVIFSFTDSLGGWSVDEMLALVGVYFLIGGVISLFIQPGMSALIDSVRDGTLDFMLTKPEDSQLLVSIQRVAIFSVIDLLLGLGVLVAALVRLGSRIGGSRRLPLPGRS